MELKNNYIESPYNSYINNVLTSHPDYILVIISARQELQPYIIRV
jgi:hypothetical protein